MVTPCHGGGRGPGDVERRGGGEVQRGFWGCSGVCLCDGVAGAGQIRGEVGLRRNCELDSHDARVGVMVRASAIRKVSCPRETRLVA